MNVQLDATEVQEAVTAYLRARGVDVADLRQVQLVILGRDGGYVNIVGCKPIVVATNVKLPKEPYR